MGVIDSILSHGLPVPPCLRVDRGADCPSGVPDSSHCLCLSSLSAPGFLCPDFEDDMAFYTQPRMPIF